MIRAVGILLATVALAASLPIPSRAAGDQLKIWKSNPAAAPITYRSPSRSHDGTYGVVAAGSPPEPPGENEWSVSR